MIEKPAEKDIVEETVEKGISVIKSFFAENTFAKI
jgi:hypothetical protein